MGNPHVPLQKAEGFKVRADVLMMQGFLPSLTSNSHFGPKPWLPPSFRQGPPESSHRDVNLNRSKDPNQASIAPLAAL